MKLVINRFVISAGTEAELTANAFFVSELDKRIKNYGEGGYENSILLAFVEDKDSLPDNDCYAIEMSENKILFRAKTMRGFIFAYSHLLRKCEIKDNKLILSKDLSGTYIPKKKIRGHQLGYRTTPNTYDAWSCSQYYQYYLDIMAFTANTCEHMPYEKGYSNRNTLMKYDEEEFLVKASNDADGIDLNLSLWHPNLDNETDEAAVKSRTTLYKRLKRLDYLFIPGGDPGELYADDFLKRVKKISTALKAIHKNALVFPSAQAPHKYKDWGDALISGLTDEPKEIDGLIMGPNHAFPMHELRKKTPNKYPLRFYPDITHNVRCEYPVNFLNDDWHYSLASTLSREAVNPRPVEFATLHKLFSPYTIGSVSYSEGVHDDLNKMIWSLLEFDPDYPLNEAVADYVRFFMPKADTELLTEAIFGLEKNWQGNPLYNPSINNTYKAFCELKQRFPHLSQNWRFLLLYFRACCDKLVLQRLKFEGDLIDEAKYFLKKLDLDTAKKILSTPFSEDYESLHTEIFDLAKTLFELIGIQLDTKNYHADSWERGATLETIDKPVTDKLWLINRISYCESLPQDEKASFISRLLNRESVDADEHYFSVAHHELVALGTEQNGEFYMNFQGDKPENDGSMPMGMLKVYDHFSLKARLGGFSANTDYLLTIAYKTNKHKEGTSHKISANGVTIYEGVQYGGMPNKVFDDELLRKGFESATYTLRSDVFINGTLELLIEEYTTGFEICEFWIKKA